MGKKKIRQMLTAIVAGSLFCSGLGYSAHAEENTTIASDPVTVKVTSDTDQSRNRDFNEDWKFYLGTSSSAQNVNFDDSSWESVSLPHDFSITQTYTTSGEAESGFLPGGTGWYRKTFVLPESDAEKTFVLNFDGVYSDAYVYVNGTLVGENHYGYTSFAFDITSELTCDGVSENVIAVKAVNNIPSSRWYSGSGIYRDVTLMVSDAVHTAYRGIQITTPNIASGNGDVKIVSVVDNDRADDQSVTIRQTIYNPSGEAVISTTSDAKTIAAGSSATYDQTLNVANPLLWSTENPYLYQVVTEVCIDGEVVDHVATTFGFRYYSFDSTNGFYLNGEAVKLNGMCLHHDQGALGSAAYKDAMYRQLSIMKDMGVNAIRTSHNPADEDFIDICNELGLLVIEEAFDGWSVSKNGNSNDFGKYFNANISSSNQLIDGDSSMTWAEYAIKSMVKRDRNDPSVILWSLGNEIQEGASADNSFPTIAQNLIDWIEEVDTTRPTTIGSNQRTTSGVLGSVHNVVKSNGGIVGFNYASSSELSSMHNTYGPIIASETSSAVNSRGIYTSQASASNADGKYHLTSYDTSNVSWGMTAHDSMWNTLTADYVAGEFVWTGFDYLGEPTPWNGTSTGSVNGAGAIPNSSYFGIVETTGFPKDTYYFYRSQWNQQETTLHLVTAWDADNMLTSSNKTPVVIYTNAPKVELYRNDSLIGIATRTVNTTNAGHTYYTYTTTTNNSSICQAETASYGSSLYATFNVSYEAGTIMAKAYDENGQEITSGISGQTSVSTPGTVSQLHATVNKNEILADGSSLAYIAIDVLDAQGVLDTTATNQISVSLSGNGEIVGVDNGDQATTAKYQQTSVLSSSSSAQIAAYAGKALVIVRSTKDAGSMTLTLSSNGLTGDSVTIRTIESGDQSTKEGLVSYTMVRDYTIKAGQQPELYTTATGTLADGTTISGTISWDAIDEETYSTAGDYTVKGVLSFEGYEDIAVTAKLHVIAEIVAMQNIATATMVGSTPQLPDKVNGIMADGSLNGEFSVTWEEISADQFTEVGEIIVVQGTATVMGSETLPVTASVRVAEAINTESVNVAPNASSLEQDIETQYQSDNLLSINNGITQPGDNTSERWTNWNNRSNSAESSLTFSWDTAQLLSSVHLYYYYDNCCAYPEKIEFSYSLNGSDFDPIDATSDLIEEYSLGAEYSYTFAQHINPVALRITFTQQDGTTGNHCVGLTEAEIMTYAGQIDYSDSAALSMIKVDGVALADFDSSVYEYTVSSSVIEATAQQNAGVTILPVYLDTVRILTISEDGTQQLTYVLKVTEAGCTHSNTEVRNQKAASCTTDGYTGDTYCSDCGALVQAGATIPATGHQVVTTNAKEATCTEVGYSGDQICEICGETISEGQVIAAKGHSYDQGAITKEPTESEEGLKTYTCTVCGEIKTETLPIVVHYSAPKVSIKAEAAAGGKIKLTGIFEDYENIDRYYNVTAHGLVYYSTSKLGTKTLTVNTPGRTRVNFSSYQADGSFSYTMKPAYATTKYTVRAFLAYTDDSGRTVYIYSSPISVSYNILNASK